MPIIIRGVAYYKTLEVCRAAGISRSTLMRWITGEIVCDASLRDRKGWRLFSENELNTIVSKAQTTSSPEVMKRVLI